MKIVTQIRNVLPKQILEGKNKHIGEKLTSVPGQTHKQALYPFHVYMCSE